MKIQIVNLTAVDITILGLPRGGVVHASDTEIYKISEDLLEGYEGLRIRLADELYRLAAAGSITYQIYPEAGDISSRTFHLRRVLDHADTDIAVAAVAAVLNISPEGMPENCVGIAVRANVTEVFDDGAGAMAACALEVGYTSNDDALLASVDVLAATAVFASAPLTTTTLFPQAPAEGEYVTATLTADANLSTLTTGTCTLDIYFITI